MLTKLPVLSLIGLALLQGVFSQQITTTNIYPGDPGGVENLRGEILGTGAEGTTYAVSGVASGITVTATFVHGSTYLSEIAAQSTRGLELEVIRECGIDANDVAVCTMVIRGEGGGVETATTAVGTATLIYAPVALEIDDSSSSSSSGAPPSELPRLAALFAAAPLVGFLVTLW